MRRCAPRDAPRNHNAILRKSLENHRFLYVRADGIGCIPLRASAPHGKSYGYWKTLENHWENMVSWPCRSKIKDNPPTVTFPGKERSQNLTFGNQWKTIENHWENMTSMPSRSKINNNSLRIPFLAKSDVKKKDSPSFVGSGHAS